MSIRIASYAMVDPAELRANPANWRVHPQAQRDQLAELLDRIGWIAPVTVNLTTGNMLDGHMRAEQALADGLDAIPVIYVELDEAEERLALATFDPLTSMAEADQAKLDALLAEFAAEDATLAAPVDDAESFLPGPVDEEPPPFIEDRFPLAIVLNLDERRQWVAYKEATGLSDDKAALLALLEGVPA